MKKKKVLELEHYQLVPSRILICEFKSTEDKPFSEERPYVYQDEEKMHYCIEIYFPEEHTHDSLTFELPSVKNDEWDFLAVDNTERIVKIIFTKS